VNTDEPGAPGAGRVRVNEARFAVVQQDKVVAIVPDGRLDEATAALFAVGVDPARVEVLQGEVGAGILDLDGTGHGHGRWAHLVRSAQKLGTAANERENYAAALPAGESVVLVPVNGDSAAALYGRVLDEHGGRRIIHFGRFRTEQLTY
jgi:hypothetical protein